MILRLEIRIRNLVFDEDISRRDIVVVVSDVPTEVAVRAFIPAVRTSYSHTTTGIECTSHWIVIMPMDRIVWRETVVPYIQQGGTVIQYYPTHQMSN